MAENFTSVLNEKRIFNPSKEFSKNAHIKSMKEYKKIYRQSIKSPEKFTIKDSKYSFELMPSDIDNLEINKKNIDKYIELVGESIINPDSKLEDLNWVWCNPIVTKSS